jgi:hypothetical protein
MTLSGHSRVVCFEQTRAMAFAMNADWGGEKAMFTSAECRGHAEEKLAQAEIDPRHRRRLITAAEAWLNLARQLGRAEATVSQMNRPLRGQPDV